MGPDATRYHRAFSETFDITKLESLTSVANELAPPPSFSNSLDHRDFPSSPAKRNKTPSDSSSS